MPEPLVSTTRLRALRSACGSGDMPILVAIHDYPDPDAIAAALAIQTLLGSWGIQAVIAHGGILGREENAEMVRLLKIDLKSYADFADLSEFRGAIFLDTQPHAKNQSLPPEVPIVAVIDHHSLGDDSVRLVSRSSRGTAQITYSDIRTSVGASSTLVCGYLETAGIVPDARLATALFLGIKTDTDSLLRDAGPADIEAYTRLLPLADMKLAGQAIHPPLDRDYYRFIHMAMEKAVLHGASLIADCGEVKSPDMLSTASDTLIGLKGIKYVLAVGCHGGSAFLSLRTKPSLSNATRVLLHIVEPEGRGGGHNLTAGGSIDVGKPWPEAIAIIRGRFLEATNDTGNSGVPLI